MGKKEKLINLLNKLSERSITGSDAVLERIVRHLEPLSEEEVEEKIEGILDVAKAEESIQLVTETIPTKFAISTAQLDMTRDEAKLGVMNILEAYMREDGETDTELYKDLIDHIDTSNEILGLYQELRSD